LTRLYDGHVTDAFRGDADLSDDARRLLAAIDQEVPGAANITADCRPPLDVLETGTSLEVLVDVPGVPPESLRIAVRRSTLLVVGAKQAAPPDPSARFHLAERSFGRFARAVQLTGAFDAAHARASVRAGQLRIVLPRLEDRRGRVIAIPVERG
jgi:HSP20 family protein